MDRLSALAKGCLAFGGLLAFGCAQPPATVGPTALPMEAVAVHVDAGPPPCSALQERIDRSEVRSASRPGTWLDAPVRMVEGRRLRALRARAQALGCDRPRI